MKNNVTRTIRSEEITIDVRICAALAANRGSSLKIKTKDVFDTFLKSVGHDMTVVHLTGE